MRIEILPRPPSRPELVVDVVWLEPELFPLLPLFGVLCHGVAQLVGHAVDRDQPVGIEHEFFLQPQRTLEVFERGEEVDQGPGDGSDGLDLALDLRQVVGREVGDVVRRRTSFLR